MTKNIDHIYRSEAFIERAMDLWGSAVFKLALAQTASRADAEDIYQEVFIRLLKDRSTFNDVEHLKAWLLRVTVNCCHDLARSGWKRKSTLVDGLVDHVEEGSRISQEALHDLEQALGSLPENMRATVHLYYYEGYSTEEIAKILNLESSTIRSRMQRAREQLKSLLGGAGYEAYERVYEQDGSNRATCLSEG